MKILTTIFFIFFIMLADAQSVQWARKGGGTASDMGKNISVDALGNSYVTGTFQNTVTFGPYSLFAPSITLNTFFAKYDALGNILWLRQISGGQNSPAAIVYCPAQNCIYMGGKFIGTITLGLCTLTTYGNNDCFFAKYDLNGSCLWAVKAGSINGEWVDDIDCDLSGNLIGTGMVWSGGLFGGFIAPTHTLYQTFTTSISPSGTFQWLTISCYTNGSGVAAPYPSVKTDVNSNIYVTGLYCSTCTFGSQILTATGSTSNSNIFIQKLSPAGNILWTVSVGGTSISESTSIAADISGNVYVTGDFSGTVDFGGISKTSYGWSDIFVAKYLSTGSLSWVQQFGNTGTDIGKSIEVFPNGNVIAAGYYTTAAQFGSFNLTSSGGSDAYIALLDASGNTYWAQSFGGTSGDVFMSAVPDNSMNIYCTGYFNGTSYYGGIPLTTAGNLDASVVKIVPPAPLPVQLLSFAAETDLKNNAVECKWITATETNNDFFTLEKSSDGKTFKTIAHLQAMISNSSYHNYEFTDEHPYTGISYYRLSQTDLNGTHEILKTITVNFKNKNSFIVECYPSVSNGEINIDANKLLSEIKVFEINGNLVKDISQSSQFIYLNLSDLKKGIYFIQCIAGDEMNSEKIIIQ